MAQHLHFVQSVEPLQGGGLGEAAWQLDRALRAGGASSRLITTRAATFEDPRQAEQFVRAGPARLFYAPGLRARAAALAEEAGAVFHGHGFYVYTNFVFGGAARRRNVPLIYHPHGSFEPWILSRSRRKKAVAHALFETANFRHARLWRALTLKEADQIRGLGIRAPISVLPNGIDPSLFDGVQKKAADPEAPTILFLGRIHPKKGIDLLLHAWAKLGSRRKNATLVLAGPDEGGYAAMIADQIKASGLEGSVKLAGALTGRKKVEALTNADAFVLTSYSEGLPMAVLEAMCCRTPVVITTACNLPEVAAAGAGWCCEVDVSAVERMLLEMIACGPEERAERGRRGRALVERQFQWETIARTLDEEARRLL